MKLNKYIYVYIKIGIIGRLERGKNDHRNPAGNRTWDLSLSRRWLYQLSYWARSDSDQSRSHLLPLQPEERKIANDPRGSLAISKFCLPHPQKKPVCRYLPVPRSKLCDPPKWWKRASSRFSWRKLWNGVKCNFSSPHH